jgi:hypothetical protein
LTDGGKAGRLAALRDLSGLPLVAKSMTLVCSPLMAREADMTDLDKVIAEAKADLLPYESWERLALVLAKGLFRI